MSESLQKINNQMKVYVNEASGISNKCRLKLIKLVEKHFLVHLPKENYLRVDITLLENGNVIMRDVEYKTSEEVTSLEELQNRYHAFQEEADVLLTRQGTNFKEMRHKNEIINLVVLFFMLLVAIVLGFYSLRLLLHGDFRGFIWMVFMIGYYFVPTTGRRFQERFHRAVKYIKSFFKK